MLPVFRDNKVEYQVGDVLVYADGEEYRLVGCSASNEIMSAMVRSGPDSMWAWCGSSWGYGSAMSYDLAKCLHPKGAALSHIERAGQRIELGGAETNVRVGSFVEHVGYGLFLVTWTPNELETRAVGHQMGYSINGGVACGHHYNTTDYLPADIVRKLLGDPSTKRVLEPHEVAEHFAAQAGGRFVRGDGVKWYSSSNNDNYIYKAFPDRHIAYRKDGSDLYGYTFEKPLSLASCTEIPAPSWASAVNGEVTHA